jgi:hypothetical protein
MVLYVYRRFFLSNSWLDGSDGSNSWSMDDKSLGVNDVLDV